jgi:hypothetical protein
LFFFVSIVIISSFMAKRISPLRVTSSYALHPAYPLPPDVTDAFVIEPAVPTEEPAPLCYNNNNIGNVQG